jgi:hypothetical protein
MKDDKRAASTPNAPGSLPNRILGSLRDALNAASRDDRSGEITLGDKGNAMATAGAAPEARKQPPPSPQPPAAARPHEMQMPPAQQPAPPTASAAHAVREAKSITREPKHFEAGEPSTQSLRASAPVAAKAAPSPAAAPKTQAVRGRPKVIRNAFHQDPVVGWLVVVGGPGLGAFRPIYEGNNGIGRGKNQRIPIDFGDDSISSEEQAYIRYDSMDRSFLFVPNLSKTNIVAINDKKPTGALKLELMDVITMGRTQLAFVPFCGEEFDWSELSDLKE